MENSIRVDDFSKSHQIKDTIGIETLERDPKMKEDKIVQIRFCGKQNLLFVITLGTITRCKVHENSLEIEQ